MKKMIRPLLLIFLSVVTAWPSLMAQPGGEPILKIFGNFHHGLSKEVRDETAFEILRAYLGYEHNWDNGWRAEVKLDIGSPDDLSPYSLIRRYSYFKNAYIAYRQDRYEIGAGLVDMLHIDIPESYWDHRYIRKEFQDQYQFGPSADIGIYGIYRLTPWLEADGFVVNGEGYNDLQRDDIYRYGGGLSVRPLPNLMLRVHYDLGVKESTQHNLSVFMGFHEENITTWGIQVVWQFNSGYEASRNRYGYSFFGMYSLHPRWQVFARYDVLRSNILPDHPVPWNLSRDGTSVVAGIQYLAMDFLKWSLNYQDWFSLAQNGPDRSYIYLNMEVAL